MVLARDLLRNTNTGFRARKESCCCSRIATQIKMDLTTILIRYVADGITIDRTQIVDHHRDGILCHGIAIQVRLDGQLVAGSARGTGALTGPSTELRLTEGGRVWVGVLRGVSAGVDCCGAVG